MKTILTLIALCVAYSSFAQIEKGRSYVTGQFGGGSSKTSDTSGGSSTKQSSYGLGLGYGYLVANTWAVGLSVSGNGNTTKYYSTNATSTGTGYSITPYVRKYFPIAEKFYIHADGGLSYAGIKSTYKYDGVPEVTDSKSKVTAVYIRPGLTYFLSNRFTLNANLGSLNYSNLQTTNGSGQKTTQKGLNASFGLNSVTFGASIFF
ncbi:MAG: outer membrane beta-barrel protein [Bacteroidota bacterium]